jgi:hypothetical protein
LREAEARNELAGSILFRIGLSTLVTLAGR